MEQATTTGGNGEVDITLAPDVGDAGMAVMMAEMIRTNLKDKPDRVKDFNKLDGYVWITADDADTEMTMLFDGGSLKVYPGKVGYPMLQISTDSSTLLDLANIQIRFGLPYYFDEVGRMVLKKLLKGELKIKGMFAHNLALTHMTKVISVK
ncbi:MAG: hypothetical protein KKF41_11875 [Actinobacteria bacterium]|nr:hypothetical protein [Actinomycetota bacterium]MBU1944289.1 hypothetical protein [Actinomycetota bacterium]MBU2688274.1 hypothetical protein [Actinomycetota bacterium]